MRHRAVKHSVGEFVKDQAHTNGIESFRSLLKRGYYGTRQGLTPSSQMNACKPTMDCKIQTWNMNLCEMYVDGVRPMSPRCNLPINNWKIQARREIGINTTLACACIDYSGPGLRWELGMGVSICTEVYI